tara:strand:+ start:195 stop:758 length:564 start_codon:yes stop_codon:yes gene_type:complete
MSYSIRDLVREQIRKLLNDEAIFSKRKMHGDVDEIEDKEDIVVDQCPSCDGYHIDGACPLSKQPQRDNMIAPDDATKDKYEVYWDNPKHGRAAVEDISDLDPDAAFALGKNMGSSGDFDDDHSHSSYMAKPQMFQVSREANSIYDMLEDDEQLDDWMESKISQASGLISSIYDSLSYKKKGHKGRSR